MSKPSPLGVIAASALATFALAGCVALGPGPTATPTPAPTPSSADEEVGDVSAPDADLSFAAGADLPRGLAATVSTTLAGDPAWEIVPTDSLPRFQHPATGCAVQYGAIAYPTDSTDDATTTMAALSELANDDQLSESPSMSSGFAYDPSGVLALVGGEPTRQMETILGETLAAFTVALAPAGLYGF